MALAAPSQSQLWRRAATVRKNEDSGKGPFEKFRWFAMSGSSGRRGAVVDHRLKVSAEANRQMLCIEETKDRIRKMFREDDTFVSSYDTAWVAMVPSLNSPETPHFRQCVNWLLDNQCHDGSWGPSHCDQFLLKDKISSTLASVLALKRWGIGEEHVNKGLRFIELNFSLALDGKQQTPTGFDIIFPGMIEFATKLGLDVPINSVDIEVMFQKRDLELKRVQGGSSEGRNAYLAYVSEGLGMLQDWEMVMKYQRKNGSLFNSPSTTAASLMHHHDLKCLYYLESILEKFGNAVPTAYPLNIYKRLWMIDVLEKMGIDRHFSEEVGSVLDETYRFWLQREEVMFLDIETCAMAFRILRIHGYNVSFDAASQFSEEDIYFNPLSGHLKDVGVALELHRASEVAYQDESTLERQNLWLNKIMKQGASFGSICSNRLQEHIDKEVDDALQFPFHANLDRLRSRTSIEHYSVADTRMFKASHCSNAFGNEAFLKLAVEDFNMCQSIHLDELGQLERWFIDNKLDQLSFARKKLAYCYFSAAATLFSPGLSEARISWAKNGVLTTVVDDFFDVGGSKEELLDLISLVERWDANVDINCCSKQVEIIFSALHTTISELGERAIAWQGRNVTSHIIEIWLELMRSMLKEAEWVENKSVPTIDEYMENGYISFALGPIVLPALYFVGPKLSEEVVGSTEFHNLFKFMSTCGRLLNDIQTVKREAKEGKLNAVLLGAIHGHGAVSEEENLKEMKKKIEQTRRQLLMMVLQSDGSAVPRACKDVFWKMSKVVHFFYFKGDGFTSHDLMNAVSAVIQQPIVLPSKGSL